MPKVKEKSLSKIMSKGNVTICSPYFNNEKESKPHGNLFGRNTITTKLPIDYQLHHERKSLNFFNQNCLDLAKQLLGQLIIHQVKGERLSGFIVETECYLGYNDAASHSYNGKRTSRNEPMFMSAGTSYVYSIYGMYHCFNISSKEEGSCVLIRALEPYENLEEMLHHRQERTKKTHNQFRYKDLCNGPSKLCQALQINKENCNKIDLVTSDDFWVENGVAIGEENIITSRRIGISSAGEECANKPLRFYVWDNSCVSKLDKKVEELRNIK